MGGGRRGGWGGPARRLQGLATPGALIGRPGRGPGADANFGSGPKPTPARWRASNARLAPFIISHVDRGASTRPTSIYVSDERGARGRPPNTAGLWPRGARDHASMFAASDKPGSRRAWRRGCAWNEHRARSAVRRADGHDARVSGEDIAIGPRV